MVNIMKNYPYENRKQFLENRRKLAKTKELKNGIILPTFGEIIFGVIAIVMIVGAMIVLSIGDKI